MAVTRHARRRCISSDTAVHQATKRLETGGFVTLERSKGRGSHTYQATLPPTANALRCSEWSTANGTYSNSERHAPNGERASNESAESAESGARFRGRPADADARERANVCVDCGVGGGAHAGDCSLMEAVA